MASTVWQGFIITLFRWRLYSYYSEANASPRSKNSVVLASKTRQALRARTMCLSTRPPSCAKSLTWQRPAWSSPKTRSKLPRTRWRTGAQSFPSRYWPWRSWRTSPRPYTSEKPTSHKPQKRYIRQALLKFTLRHFCAWSIRSVCDASPTAASRLCSTPRPKDPWTLSLPSSHHRVNMWQNHAHFNRIHRSVYL